MRKLATLCRKYNRIGQRRICVIKAGRGQYYLRSWLACESSFGSSVVKFERLSDCVSYVQSLFR